MEANLKLARDIVCSFVVNVKEHPEYLEKCGVLGAVECKRNSKVATAMLAIDELIKSL